MANSSLRLGERSHGKQEVMKAQEFVTKILEEIKKKK